MLDNKRYIYVVLTQTGTNISKAIKCFTRAPYNHTSITSDLELCEMFSFCRINKNRPLPAGFFHEKVDDGVFEMFNSIPCEIYGFEVDDEQLAKYNNLIEHFKKETKLYSYNLLGLLTIALGIPLNRKKRFVCSQFVAHMLAESGIATFDKDVSLVKPDDFRHLPNGKLIYSGDIKKYFSNKLAIV